MEHRISLGARAGWFVLFFIPICFAWHFAGAQNVEVVATFDYPLQNTNTYPSAINDRGEVAGFFSDPRHYGRGFIRVRNGTFSNPIVEPNDNSNGTYPRGITNSGFISGFYVNAYFGDHAHGFFLSGNTFTEFDIPDANETWVYKLNAAGDFVGNYSNIGGTLFTGFIDIGGAVTTFLVPGSSWVTPVAVNNFDEVVGIYYDNHGYSHGFYRSASGALTYPLDVSGAVENHLAGINDRGQIVGNYVDTRLRSHGLIMTLSGKQLSYDFPDASQTTLTGINNRGYICGSYYQDNSSHGFIARLTR
jgi:hypothetical protein